MRVVLFECDAGYYFQTHTVTTCITNALSQLLSFLSISEQARHRWQRGSTPWGALRSIPPSRSHDASTAQQLSRAPRQLKRADSGAVLASEMGPVPVTRKDLGAGPELAMRWGTTWAPQALHHGGQMRLAVGLQWPAVMEWHGSDLRSNTTSKWDWPLPKTRRASLRLGHLARTVVALERVGSAAAGPGACNEVQQAEEWMEWAKRARSRCSPPKVKVPRRALTFLDTVLL